MADTQHKYNLKNDVFCEEAFIQHSWKESGSVFVTMEQWNSKWKRFVTVRGIAVTKFVNMENDLTN